MAKATDTMNRNCITRPCPGMPQGIERGSARAHQWTRLLERERVGNACQGILWRHHIFGITAVVRKPDDLAPDAIDEVSLATGRADKATAAVPTNAYAITLLPYVHIGGHSIDHPGDFMAGDTRQLHAVQSEPCDILAATHTTGIHFYPYLPRTGIGHWKTCQHEGAACLHCLHGSHGRCTHSRSPRDVMLVLSCSIAHSVLILYLHYGRGGLKSYEIRPEGRKNKAISAPPLASGKCWLPGAGDVHPAPHHPLFGPKSRAASSSGTTRLISPYGWACSSPRNTASTSSVPAMLFM